jgi:hypothetical protein
MLKKLRAPGSRLEKKGSSLRAPGCLVVPPEFEDAAPSTFSQAQQLFTAGAWSLEPGAFSETRAFFST